MLAPAIETLITSANSNGGWGYYAGKTSRIEPTCWMLLALARNDNIDLDLHRRFLAGCQQPSGVLVENAALPANFAFNALSAIVMLDGKRIFGEVPIRRLLNALVQHKGESAGQVPQFRQNNALQGWSWVEGTFSWVEPTSWAVLALKRARASALLPEAGNDRIREGEQLLADRCCRDGGWNYGNSNAFGKELHPHIPTTALALLAMRDRGDSPEVVKSLKYLEAAWSTESSTIALGLTAICLRSFGRPIEPVVARLSSCLPVAEELGNLHALAIAHYALQPAGPVDGIAL